MTNKRPDWSAIWDVCIKVAFPILLGMAGWTFSSIQGLQHRLTVIEASRYSRDDAREDRDALRAELAAIRQQQAVSASDFAYIKRAVDKLVTQREKR